MGKLLTVATCEACDVEVVGRKFCSDRCRCWARLHPGEKRQSGRVCQRCGIEIDHKSTHAKFCSTECGAIARGDKLPGYQAKRCVRCDAEFTPRRRDQLGCPTCAAAVSSKRKKDRMRREDPDTLARWRRDYRQRNPEKTKEHRRRSEAKRRAAKAGSLVFSFTAEELAARLSMFAGCWLCGAPATEVDHVKPLAAGGAHALANLRPACGPCNRRKYSKWNGVDALARQ